MAFSPIPNAARLEVRLLGPQLQLMEFGSYWTLTTPAPMDSADVLALAEAADLAASTRLKTGIILAAVVYNGVEARALDTSSSPVATAAAHAGNGTRDGVMLPAEVAMVASFGSGIAGRSHRNRWYFPGLATGDLDTSGSGQGLFSASIVATMTTQFGAFLADISAAGYSHVIGSPKLGSFVAVTSMQVQRRPGSQRRREP